MSYSFISAIENGRKKEPSNEQISNILKSIVENNHSEFNYHSEKIKELSNGDIDLGIYVDSATSILDAATNKKFLLTLLNHIRIMVTIMIFQLMI